MEVAGDRPEIRRECAQVVVMGGGPAGATAATILAQGGIQVVLLERERMPRFHIGESLMTETYWPLRRLGMLERLRASDFPRKHSVQFFTESGKATKPFYFRDHNPHESSVTWQVERAEFDRMLLENAQEKGVDVRTDSRAERVLFDGNRATGVRGTDDSGGAFEIGANVVVDATGLGFLLARQLGIARKDVKLGKVAVYAHFADGRRDPGIDEGATLVINTRGNRGWFWYIPLSRNRVSVGVVGNPGELVKDRGAPEKVLDEEIAECAPVRERLAVARRISDVRVTGDYTWRSTRCSGDGWVLVGDAFGFIDPIYSSGVLLALKSGEAAADTILGAFEARDFSAARLGSYGPVIAEGMEALRKLVYAFYTPGFSFASFVSQHPEHRPRLIQLLIGDVFKEPVREIFEAMKSMCDLPEAMPLEVGPLAGSSAGGRP